MLTLPATQAPHSPIRARALVFEDPLSKRLCERIERIAVSDAPVLITGETGTGKEIVARRLHALSRRSERPFVAVNVGAFSETLIESELFGHEKGAFTGAFAARSGFFEAAQGGTLFLDEIGELPWPLQVKLLRVLQEGQVTRLGARAPIDVDVRLVAATNVDLQAAMRAKHFREDLFYRLRVSSLSLPPLRERPGDILPLAWHFLELYQRKLGRSSVRLSANATTRLLQHSWPGNIRELENTIHHALVVCQGDELSLSDLELGTPLLSNVEEHRSLPESESELSALESVFERLIAQRSPELHATVERTLFAAAYRASGENQLETARVLGVSRNVVRARLIEHGRLEGPLRRSVKRTSQSLRIGYQKLGLIALLKRAGALEAALGSENLHVEWTEYEGGIQLVSALKNGLLDLAGIGDCPAVVAQAERVPIVYVAAEPPAPRGAALVVPADSRLRSVAELRGRSVVVNRAAQAHLLLMRALEEACVRRDEVDIRFEPPARAWAAFEAGEVDAWAIWDPFLSSARLELGARILRDASGLCTNSTYYVARRSFADQYPSALNQVLRALRGAARWAREEPARAAELLTHGFGLSSAAWQASWQRELEPVPVGARLLAAQQDVADALHRFEIIAEPVSVSDAAWHYRLTG